MLIELHGGPNDGQALEVPDGFVEVCPPHPSNLDHPPSWYRLDADGVWRYEVAS
jgi:hypothetical protein